MLMIGGLILAAAALGIIGCVLYNKHKGKYAPQIDKEASTQRFPVVELQDGWEDKGVDKF
jgi:hypothetical protein